MINSNLDIIGIFSLQKQFLDNYLLYIFSYCTKSNYKYCVDCHRNTQLWPHSLLERSSAGSGHFSHENGMRTRMWIVSTGWVEHLIHMFHSVHIRGPSWTLWVQSSKQFTIHKAKCKQLTWLMTRNCWEFLVISHTSAMDVWHAQCKYL